MRNPRYPIFFFACFILLVSASCLVGSQQQLKTNATPALKGSTTELPAETAAVVTPPSQPTAPSLAATEETSPSAPSPAATEETSPSAVPPAAETAPCEKKVCIESGFFLLARPIGPDGRNAIDTSSRYGSINKRTREAYNGVQFLNSSGTPVLAAADGTVVVAGDDSLETYALRPNTYGNLVILKHSLPGVSEPVFTLYAHLSKLDVKVDDTVKSGQQIGQVGMTGSVRGSTLYFEVRVGKNTYQAARNPELWLEPLPDETGDQMGALAGNVINNQGNYVHITNILIQNVRKTNGPKIRQLYLKTYYDRDQRGLSPWEESFAASYLPEGTYKISFWYRSILYQREVEVQPNMLTFVTFRVK